MNNSEKFTYWRKPHHKWLLLVSIILQIIPLYYGVEHFLDISRPEIRNELFSQNGWESYAAGKYFQFSLSGSIIFLCLYCFIIGFYVKNKKLMDICMCICMIILTLFWGMIAFIIPIFENTSNTIFWSIMLIISFVSFLYSVKEIRK